MTEQEAHDKFGNYIKDAAFPQTVETYEKIFHTKGLTKREYFAAMAMQGLLAAQNVYETGVNHDLNATHSVLSADAIIKALNEIKP